MNENLIRELNGAALAYLGDAVLELLTRRFLLSLGLTGSGKLNHLALRFVKATVLSKAVDSLLPHLTEAEEYAFKRGRNASGISAPKSASTLEYRRATGFEAVFGWLDIMGQHERAAELFNLAYADTIAAMQSEFKGDIPCQK